MPHITQQLQQNLDQINTRISEACKRAGRSTDEVKLIAVTKYAQTAWIEGLLELGYFKWGESRPQQLLERVELFANQTDQIQWHMIGQLQRNKVRKLLPAVSLIHSVDSLKLLLAIDRIAQEEQQQPQVLLQVNTSEEAAKQGFSVEELKASWAQVESVSNAQVCGLMTMAPKVEHIEETRPCFAALRELREELRPRSSKHVLQHLSMGMSRDFEVAVEEGATLIRVGSSLYTGLGDA